MVTVQHLVKGLLKKFVIKHFCHLKFDDCVIKVSSNSSLLIQDLKKYYWIFLTKPQTPDMQVIACEGKSIKFDVRFNVKQPDPGKNEIKEEFIDLSDGLHRGNGKQNPFLAYHAWHSDWRGFCGADGLDGKQFPELHPHADRTSGCQNHGGDAQRPG
jgi:hypothetical protein